MKLSSKSNLAKRAVPSKVTSRRLDVYLLAALRVLGRNISASCCQVVGGASAGRNRHPNDTGSLSTRGSATIRAPRHGFVVAPAAKSAHYNANVTACILGCSNLNLRRCASNLPVPQGITQVEIEDRESGRGKGHTHAAVAAGLAEAIGAGVGISCLDLWGAAGSRRHLHTTHT